MAFSLICLLGPGRPAEASPRPHPVFREYRIGPVRSGTRRPPSLDVFTELPDSIRAIQETISHRPWHPSVTRGGPFRVDTVGQVLSGNDSVDFAVMRGGQAVYRFKAYDPVRDPILGFSLLKDRWILQTWNRLIVDGTDIARSRGLDSLFNGRALREGLFYFAKARGGRVYRAYWEGIPIGKRYAYIPHDFCCGGTVLNVIDRESTVGFYGVRQGSWYFAVIDFP